MKIHCLLPLLTTSLLFALPGLAALPAAKAIDALAADYLAVREVRGLSQPLTLAEALQVQKRFVKKLEPALGKPAGYKVGLVAREMQQRFGLDAPVRGVLLEKMLLPNHAEVPAGFAVRPLLEADLIVVVKDKGINQAQTLLEVAEHLKEVAAFIELPDTFLPTNPPPSGALLVAANVGARLGVIGQRLPVKGTADFVQALADLKVSILGQSGAELGRGEGRAILDHPLNAVLWLLEELRESGGRLKAGDLISLGSIKAIPAPKDTSVTVRYQGLPGGPIEASVRLR
jgi:2-keto-4-pentenoate hydratase